MTHIDDLVARVEAGERSNELDVLVEVAVFRASKNWKAIRANAAGTKVIYTDIPGKEFTCRARDWSEWPAALAALRARLTKGQDDDA